MNPNDLVVTNPSFWIVLVAVALFVIHGILANDRYKRAQAHERAERYRKDALLRSYERQWEAEDALWLLEGDRNDAPYGSPEHTKQHEILVARGKAIMCARDVISTSLL